MRFAIKVLSRSDLTFFEPQYRVRNAGNQKSINLNRDVFVDELFPALPELLAAGHGELEVRLRVNGPGAAHDEIRVVRKISKGGTYKNYRLNGEFVRNPEDDGVRFNSLAPGDLAVLAFEGAAQPTLIRLFVLSAAALEDAPLMAALRPSGGPSMVSIDGAALAAAAALAPPDHPIHDLLLDRASAEDLERAAQGDAEAARRLLRRPGRRRVTAEQLAEARRRAEETGQDGELLVRSHLEAGTEPWVWRSAENAISPWDFERGVAPAATRIEVKATRGAHAAPFHLSMAELEAAAEPTPYAIWRISGLGATGGRLQIADEVRPFARDILKRLDGLPAGVRPDGFTVDPKLLTWSGPLDLDWPEADEP